MAKLNRIVVIGGNQSGKTWLIRSICEDDSVIYHNTVYGRSTQYRTRIDDDTFEFIEISWQYDGWSNQNVMPRVLVDNSARADLILICANGTSLDSLQTGYRIKSAVCKRFPEANVRCVTTHYDEYMCEYNTRHDDGTRFRDIYVSSRTGYGVDVILRSFKPTNITSLDILAYTAIYRIKYPNVMWKYLKDYNSLMKRYPNVKDMWFIQSDKRMRWSGSLTGLFTPV